MWLQCEQPAYNAWALVRALYLQQTHLPPQLSSRETLWGVVWPWRDLVPSSSCSADQEDARGAGSNTILGRGPWRLAKGWRLAERDRPAASATVVLHGLDGWAAFAFQPIAEGGQRCAATDSSRGGIFSYPFSSSAFKAAYDMLSSFSSSSLPQ